MAELGDGLFAVVRVRHHLGDHRIVEAVDLRAAFHERIDANAFGERDLSQHTGARLKATRGILGVHAHFDGVAAGLRNALERHGFAGRESNHPLHEIHARDQLGHTVFDLQARVHFQEVELFAIVVVHELHRTCGAVAHGPADVYRAGQ